MPARTIGWEYVYPKLVTLGSVHWFTEDRLDSHRGDIAPAEYKTAFYAAQQTNHPRVGIQ